MKAFLTALAVFFGLSAAAMAANPAPPPPAGSPMGVGSGDMRGPGGAQAPSSNEALPNTPPAPPEAHAPGLSDDMDMSKSPAWGDNHDAPPPDEMNDNDEGDDNHVAPPPHGKDGKASPPPHGGMGGPQGGPPGKFDPKKMNPPDSPENPEDE